MNRALLCLTIAGLLASCHQSDRPLRLAPLLWGLGPSLQSHWNEFGRDSVQYKNAADMNLGSITSVQELVAHRLDIAAIQNDARITLAQDSAPSPRADRLIRSIWPLGTQVLFIVCRADNRALTLAELVRGKQIGVALRGSGSLQLIAALLAHHGLDPASYITRRCAYEQNWPSDSVDVSFILRPNSDAMVRKLIADPRYRLFSLDVPRYGEQSSYVDGFCLNYPFARPYFLPRGALGTVPTAPVLTVAVDMVLVCRASQDPEQVARMVGTLIEHRSQLVSDNVVFQDMPTSLEGRTLQYPLHEGVRQYLARDQPTFFERYAELFGLVITLISLGYAGLVTVVQTRKRKLKNKIDTYYAAVIEIEQRALGLNALRELEAARLQLDEVRHEALRELAAERLAADASFVIFLDLIRSATAALAQRKHELQAQHDAD